MRRTIRVRVRSCEPWTPIRMTSPTWRVQVGNQQARAEAYAEWLCEDLADRDWE